MRTGIYARISSDRDGTQLGVKRQIADCEKLAESKGWSVVRHYVDDDISAYSGKPRPAYRELVQDIETKALDAVIVWHLDRLHRQPKELEEFFEIVDAAGGTKLASVTGDVDLSTHDGRFTARILGAVARKESDDKSRRIRRKAQELAEAGRIGGGGSRPFGYESDRKTIREQEAAIVRECAARFLAGDSLRALCADLNARGIQTVSGGEWRTPVLRRMLMSGRISGQREHHGELVAQAEWPGIITPADTSRIRAILASPERRKNGNPRRYLLVRLLKCEHCGAVMVSRPRDDGARRYICAGGVNFSGCGKTYILAETLEQFVVEAVLARLDSPELARQLAAPTDDPDATYWQKEVDEADAQLVELARLHGEGSIRVTEWLSARKPVERRREAATRELRRLSRTEAIAAHIGQAAELRRSWATLPLSRQHSIVAAVLDHVQVGPARRGFNRFDPSRLTPVWRV